MPGRTLEDQGKGDLEYWLSRSPAEPLAVVEFLRQCIDAYDPATSKIERVFELAEREPI